MILWMDDVMVSTRVSFRGGEMHFATITVGRGGSTNQRPAANGFRNHPWGRGGG